MEWLNELDWTLVLGIISLGLLTAVILTLVISFVLAQSNDEKFIKDLAYLSSSGRVFCIDRPKNRVVYFDLSKADQKRSCDLNTFYGSFPKKDQGRVRSWVSDMLDGKQASGFLQTDVYLHKEKRYAASYLRATKINAQEGRLHLESFLLKNTTKKKSTLFDHPFVSEKRFADAIKDAGTECGYCFAFGIKRRRIDGYDNTVPRNISYKFREALEIYLAGNTKLLKVNDNELMVANLDISDSEEALSYALRAINGADTAVGSKNKEKEADYIIKAAIVNNKDLYGDARSIIMAARRCLANAFETSDSVIPYKKGFDGYSDEDVSNFRSEVERIIYDRRIGYFFKPIYGVNTHSVYGYISKAVPDPETTSFSSIEELKNYAQRAKDQNSLFAFLAKNTVSRFITERPLKSQRLFYPLFVRELEAVPSFFQSLKGAKEANIFFLLQEDDLLAEARKDGEENVIELIEEVRRSKFKVAICLKGKSLMVDDSLLKHFDAFVVDFTSDRPKQHMDTAIRSQLHALVERLLKYGKTIIATNLADWNAIELVAGSGIDYISSDQFGPYAPSLPDPAFKEKDEMKLRELNRRPR